MADFYTILTDLCVVHELDRFLRRVLRPEAYEPDTLRLSIKLTSDLIPAAFISLPRERSNIRWILEKPDTNALQKGWGQRVIRAS